MKSQSIAELVEQDNVRAYVLYYFGIRFYEYSEYTLEQVCHEKGLSTDLVIKELEHPGIHFTESELPLISYPLDLIIEYLKHAHFIFVKHKLPYIGRLVESFKANHKQYDQIEKDLKILFPLFLEDFIHHIYEEEDTLFKYIRLLEKASQGKANPAQLYYMIEKSSLQKCAIEHEAHDDEMAGIRRITKDYHLAPDAPLHVKVIYTELLKFEESLIAHARVENEILFPKAMALENQVKKKFFERSKFN
ncbi:MAG TPA: iron-sulfur cluster repair di-iron protein [Cyclobacteriaceae bacterium]|nr:iron-sulfur cluster repair di-iron protein [Cytophagales bacterium]HRE67393.1 iron-sulfur cluster repair di-iron protein [Cyclobacteriaceae bacterium]HRF33416.1 iron-sulfur cluster repair di-iron protein [Cyclobacteriaceae bacterium]